MSTSGSPRIAPTLALTLFVGVSTLALAPSAQAQVEVKQVVDQGPYDPVTIEVTGPQLDEAKGVNPFADYRLDVTFSDGKDSFRVPGYFTGCADAADRGCTAGKLWRAHFVPKHGGAWTYALSFRTGADIVPTGAEGSPVAKVDGATGQFTVGATPRNAIRARGLMTYTGERYFRWSGTNGLFFKFGPESPENMLAYAGFDATPNAKNLRKTWAPHERDFDASATKYLWRGDRGKGLLGSLRYLSDEKLNSVSLLLFNVGGDDRNVIPQLLKVPDAAYAAMEPKAQWDEGVVHDRYDVSKLDQWHRALSYADELGIHLHFKLGEQENDHFMDGGELGRERKIYQREMVARFNHFLAVTWNFGEENTQEPASISAQTRYVRSMDPYNHALVLHTFPTQQERYRPLLGEASALNALSLQGMFSNFRDIRPETIKWLAESKAAGKQWVIGYDEQGGAQGGAPVDADYPADKLPSKRDIEIPHELFRRAALWNALMAGGYGLEAYYGYQTGCTDLNCEDHRTRASLWKDGTKATAFFDRYIGVDALNMSARDDLTGNPDDYVFAELGKTYAIYIKTDLPPGPSVPQERRVLGDVPINLALYGQSGRYSVGWYDALKGGDLQKTAITEVAGGGQVNLGKPPTGGSTEWVALVKRLP
jgi:hypothetical protein